MAQKVRIDSIDWYIDDQRRVQVLCPVHQLRMRQIKHHPRGIQCADCPGYHMLPRDYWDEIEYVKDRIDAKVFKGMKVLNLDDEAVPIAESKAKSQDGRYFVTALLTESKVGQRLVVYAGERGKKEKTQVFVEPGIKRIAFDQKDVHPTDVFLKLEATFDDGTKASIEQPSEVSSGN